MAFNSKKNKLNNINIAGSKVLKDREKEGIQEYLNQLDIALCNKAVFNVALSGGHGTGKSSIIKTFLDDKKTKNSNKYIVISTGSFLSYNLSNNKEKENETNMENNAEEQGVANKEREESNNSINIDELKVVDKIEESILKQLIHLNSYEEMPQSSLKRIKKFAPFINYLFSFFIINIVIICLVFSNKDLFYILSDMVNHIKLNYDFIMYIDFIILLLVFCLLVYYILNELLYSSKSKKIKTEVVDVEFGGFEDLPFNKKLFEILYIFKKNRIKAVFFEDIDRFSEDIVMMVIEELKELNTIINTITNTSKVIKRKVTFVYEFKDNIFKNYLDRNKFYDYIISVMPLSTPLNSIYLLDNLCKNNNCEIDLDLIKIVSKYITDYRTMINIINDHLLFRKILDIPDCEAIYLFATMVYKNTEINEYDNLLSSNNHLDELIRSINLNIKTKLAEINAILEDIESLKNTGIIRSQKNNENYNDDEYLEWTLASLFDMDENGNLLAADGISIISQEEFIKDTKKMIFDFDKYKCSNLELQKVARDMWNKCPGPFVSSYIRDIKRRKELLLNRPQMIDYNYIDIEKDENVSDLVFDLIVSGFLNDKYLEYMSLPTNNELFTNNDYKYVLRISHDYVVPDIILDNVQSIINYVDPSIHHNLRNYSLFDNYCLQGTKVKKDYAIFFREVLKEFSELDDSKINFINAYYENTKTIDKTGFYHLIAKLTKDVNFVDNLEYYYNSDKRDKNIILDNIIYSIIDVVDLSKEINQTDFFNIYINENKRIISKFNLSYAYILNNFKYLNIKISDVSLLDLKSQKIAFENNLYSFSKENSEIYSFSFGGSNKQFVEYALANIEEFYEEYYRVNKDVKIDNNNVMKRIIEQNISKSIKTGIALREKYKLTKEQNMGLTWRSVIMKHNKGVNKDILVNYIISNAEAFFSDTTKIYPLKDKVFNKKLFIKLFELDLLSECKQYYNELHKLDFRNYYLKIDYNPQYSSEIADFMIDKFMIVINEKNAQLVINSDNISIRNKGRYFYSAVGERGYKKYISLIQQDEQVLKELLKLGDSKFKIGVLMDLSLSNDELISLYPLIFTEDRFYEFRKNEFDKIIQPNIVMFDYKLEYQYYYVKKK